MMATTTKTQTRTAKVAKASGKIRWVVASVWNNGKDQAGLGTGGVQYAIARRSDGQYAATKKAKTGKAVELGVGSFSTAYWLAVNDNKKVAEAANKRTAAAEARKAAKDAPKATERQTVG